jgi:hypothetical protein
MSKGDSMKRLVVFSVASWAIVLLFGSPAHAQSRTWVSGVGDDANPCSRTAPCKTFAGAISKTAAGGEIDALDPGGFGAVTITKAITIDGSGTFAGILASLVNGIIVNAGVNDVVTIRGLSIDGFGNGLNGIRFLAGKALHVENCVIFKFTNNGVDFEPSGASELLIKDSVIRDSGLVGVLVKPVPSTGSARGSLQNVRLERSVSGIRVEDNSKVSIDGSVLSNNLNNGVRAFSTSGGTVEVNVQGSMVANNGNGISSTNAGATVRLATNIIVNNNVGLLSTGGAILSFGNNRIDGNPGGDGAPTGTIAEQ